MNNQIIEINNNKINDKDTIIINGLIKYKYLNNRIIKKLINKLELYHISYNINNIEKIFTDNNYQKYYLKFLKEKQIKEDINHICKYLEDNILRRKTKKLLKEIELIISG